MKNKVGHKILFIDQACEIGGAELNLIPIARSIPNSAVAVFEKGIFYNRLIDEKIDAIILGIDGKELKFSKKMNGLMKAFYHLPSLLAAFKKMITVMKKYEIICFNTQKALVLGILPAILMRKKTALYLHDIVSEEHFSPSNIKIIVACANRCNKVICNSEATKEAFVVHGGKADKAKVVYCGIDSSIFDNIDPADIIRFKSKIGIAGKITIGSFSRIAEWKGQHVLIKAMKYLPENYHCLIVGSPFFGEEEYYLELKRMVKNRNLINRVHFIGFNNNVPLIMKSCDIIAHTSTAPEPFGRVIVEGMLAKKPVIATNMGGAKEIINDGIDGLLIVPNDHRLLATEIKKIISDKSLIAKYSTQARISAIKNFGEKKMVQGAIRAIDKTFLHQTIV